MSDLSCDGHHMRQPNLSEHSGQAAARMICQVLRVFFSLHAIGMHTTKCTGLYSMATCGLVVKTKQYCLTSYSLAERLACQDDDSIRAQGSSYITGAVATSCWEQGNKWPGCPGSLGKRSSAGICEHMQPKEKQLSAYPSVQYVYTPC
jgi:hypothetical protein